MFSLKIGQEAGMDAFAFVVALVQALAWPSAIVAIVWLLRGRLTNALTRIVEITFPGGALKFSEKLQELKETSQEVIAAQPPEVAKKIVEERGPISVESADPGASPEAIIILSYKQVEDAISAASVALGFAVDDRSLSVAIPQTLERIELVNRKLTEYLRRLRHLRNQIAHVAGTQVTREEARDYAEQCQTFIKLLNEAVERYKRGKID